MEESVLGEEREGKLRMLAGKNELKRREAVQEERGLL